MKKRILYIGNALSRKGTTQTTIETLSALLRLEGHTTHITSGKRLKLLRLLDMILTTLKLHSRIDVILIDTYSTTNFWYAVILGRLSEFLKIPYIPILHGGDLPRRIKNSPKMSSRLFSRSKVNIAPSNYLLEAFNNNGYTNLQFIPNTLEIKKYPVKITETLSPTLLWVRSFSKIYNPLMALKVLKKLQGQFPKATLTMVGPEKDDSYEECLAFAKAQHLPVHFTGLLSKEDWIQLATSHDIFINTTNVDNTPVSLIEAMALGLPIVSTNVGGIPFLIDDGHDGLLAPANDVQAFSGRLSQLLNDPSLALKLAQNARKKAEVFDWSVVKKRWEEVLS